MSVVIIDSGGANLASLEFAFRRLGVCPEVTSDPAAVLMADRVVLPGVGAAGAAMKRLRAAGLAELLPTLTQPVLGVCLGMQLFFERSEEGPTTGLGLLPSTIGSLCPGPGLRVPHMGWNTLRALRRDPLMEGVGEGEYVYFVHSFGAPVSYYTVATYEHGSPLSAIVRQDNFWGTQFHPERSAETGARILRNFLYL